MANLTGAHSADGEWWWGDGQWHRAWSDDRLWWFDGERWVQPGAWAPPAKRPVPKLVKWGSMAWLALWLVSTVLLAVLVQTQSTVQGTAATVWAIVLVILGVIWVAGMVAWGFVLVSKGHSRYVGMAILCVTALLIGLYVFSMASSSDQDSDIAAGAGVVIGAIPALLLVAALIGLGAGLGRLTRGHSARRAATAAT